MNLKQLNIVVYIYLYYRISYITSIHFPCLNLQQQTLVCTYQWQTHICINTNSFKFDQICPWRKVDASPPRKRLLTMVVFKPIGQSIHIYTNEPQVSMNSWAPTYKPYLFCWGNVRSSDCFRISIKSQTVISFSWKGKNHVSYNFWCAKFLSSLTCLLNPFYIWNRF